MIGTLLAQQPKNIGGSFRGFGPLGETESFLGKEGMAGLFNQTISVIIGVLTICAGLWFIFQFFIGAFGWITAGSDKASLENAQKKLTNSVVGLVIVVAAIFIIDLIGTLLGFEILRPGKFILDIWK